MKCAKALHVLCVAATNGQRWRAEIHPDRPEIPIGTVERHFGAARARNVQECCRFPEIGRKIVGTDRPGSVRRITAPLEVMRVERPAPAAPMVGRAAERPNTRFMEKQVFRAGIVAPIEVLRRGRGLHAARLE